MFPSVCDDINKIATMKRTSVNDLINSILQDYVTENADLLEKYADTFGEDFKQNMAADIKTYSVKEVEDILKVKSRTIRNYITTGRLKASKVGRSYVVTLTDLEKFITSNANQKNVTLKNSNRKQ